MKRLRIVAHLADPASAEVARVLLHGEGITAWVHPRDPLSGPLASAQGGVKLLVPAEDEAAALELLRGTELSDRELGYLATGRLGPVD